MDYYGVYGDTHLIEQNIEYVVDDIIDESHSVPGISVFDKIVGISVRDFLRIIFLIHLTITGLILVAYYENNNSINYSITRLQLLVVISSLWALMYCMC